MSIFTDPIIEGLFIGWVFCLILMGLALTIMILFAMPKQRRADRALGKFIPWYKYPTMTLWISQVLLAIGLIINGLTAFHIIPFNLFLETAGILLMLLALVILFFYLRKVIRQIKLRG